MTELSEDSESVRMALGAAWDDALACRAYSGYLRPWTEDDSRATTEAIVRSGVCLYECVKCVDDGISSVRLLRDARQAGDETQLLADAKFWRNELALAAAQVVQYADEAAALRQRLETRLGVLATERKIVARTVDPMPWPNAEREAWRTAGPATGVRLPLEPFPGSYPEWWNAHLGLSPGYLVGKLRAAGEVFFTAETPVGAWARIARRKAHHDWTQLDQVVRLSASAAASCCWNCPPCRSD